MTLAFADDKCAFAIPSAALNDALVAKLWAKVSNRRTRLISDVTLGNFVDEGLVELSKINALLKKQEAA